MKIKELLSLFRLTCDVREAGGGRLTHGEGKDLHPHIERAGAA